MYEFQQTSKTWSQWTLLKPPDSCVFATSSWGQGLNDWGQGVLYLCQGTTRINERVSDMCTRDGDLIRERARVNGLIHINSISTDLSLKNNNRDKNFPNFHFIISFFPLGDILRTIVKLLSNDLYFVWKQGKDPEEED